MPSRVPNLPNSGYHPQQVVLTLYGDYLLRVEGGIAIETLIKLLSNFGLSSQAVRSATSRMSRKGLLVSKKIGRRSYYSLTNDGRLLLSERAQRISKRKTTPWNGHWNIITYSIPERTREIRDTFRRELTWLGYGPLSEATWISPYDMTTEVSEVAKELNIKDCVQIFSAKQLGTANPKKLADECWQLEKIQEKYKKYLEKYQQRFEDYQKRLEASDEIAPSECFVERFHLIQEFRKLPFFDRDLPSELLPEHWLRPQVASLFQDYNQLLFKKANEYFDSVFAVDAAASDIKEKSGRSVKK